MTGAPLAILLLSSLIALGFAAQATDGTPKGLAPCPSTPNCVSSFAEDPSKALPPLAYDLPEKQVMDLIREIVESSARARVVAENPLYLGAEYRSRLFRFVDDVEFALDPEAKRIHFRSASRTGHYDWGVNWRRMERFCQRLAQQEGITITRARAPFENR
ncbi:MAG TPA: DUF1499 domain-containing protein [Vicinamibacteria bacterium]|jgi:uncharacterized protein (DUF1499 family)